MGDDTRVFTGVDVNLNVRGAHGFMAVVFASSTWPGRRSSAWRAVDLTVGLDVYKVMNNNVTLAFNHTFATTPTDWLTPTTYMNPHVFRLTLNSPGRRGNCGGESLSVTRGLAYAARMRAA